MAGPRRCGTCRQRKKRCDGTTPTCLRCVESGFSCDGYYRTFVWRNMTARYNSEDTAAIHIPQRAKHNLTSAMTVTLPPSLASTAAQLQYFGSFMSTSLPYGRLLSEEASELSTNGWMADIEELYRVENALKSVTLALGVAKQAADARDTRLTADSLQVYNRSVAELTRALSSPQRVSGNGLLAAVRLMQIYELYFGNLVSWQAHVEGHLAILSARGPHSFKTGASHQLFVDGRILVISYSLRRRIRSPLSTHTWRTVPWSSQKKSVKDKLLDIFDDVPALLWQLDQLQGCESTTLGAPLRADIRRQCQRLKRATDTWKGNSALRLHQFDYATVGLPVPSPKSDVEYAILHLSCMYWAVCLLLESTMGAAGDIFRGVDVPSYIASGNSPGSPSNARDMGSSAAQLAASQYASKIAHTAHLFFEPRAGFVQSCSSIVLIALASIQLSTTKLPNASYTGVAALEKFYRRPFMGSYIGRLFGRPDS